MSGHEQFADNLALHALGALQGSDRTALETHLQECASCRRELELLRGDAALLALSVSGPNPPARARQRLMSALAKEPGRKEAPKTVGWWTLVSAFAIFMLASVAIFLWNEKADLQVKVAELQKEAIDQQSELQRARNIVSTLTATDALRVTLVAAKTPPQPQGRAIYDRERSSLIFLASNMPSLPDGKAYELWLIPTQGAPIPAGVFKPDAHGSATVVNPPVPKDVQAKAFAITVENEEGSPVPTSPVLMVGQGE
jgi:anti-sigma-K factor RskA